MKLATRPFVPVADAAVGVVVASAAPTSAAAVAVPTERAPKSCGKITIIDTAVITREEGTDPVTWRSGGYRYQISDNFAIDVASSYKQRLENGQTDPEALLHDYSHIRRLVRRKGEREEDDVGRRDARSVNPQRTEVRAAFTDTTDCRSFKFLTYEPESPSV